ncbi:hypothetical protein GCM10027048_45880 [Hymenobacter coalescens]
MTIRYLLGPLLLAGLALGCRKVDFGPDEGYSARDANNYPMAYQDNTDWTSDEEWKKVERELFKDSGVDLKQSQRGGVGTLSLFPNPVVQTATFIIQSGSSSRPNTAPALHGKLVLVDKKYKTLYTVPIETRGGNAAQQYRLDLAPDKFKPGRMYRMYYIFYNDNNALYLKGHGDIKVGE